MGYVQWDKVAPDTSNGSKFLRLKSGNTFKVRPLLLPVHFWKFFHDKDGKKRNAVVSEEVIEQMMATHPELKKPANRYAIYIIDRADEKVKIMEGPQTVFREFRNRFEATGDKPGGGADGGDWQIKITGVGLNTNYAITFLNQTPLTDEEKEKIKEELGGDKDKLQKIFKFCTVEEAEAKLFSDGEEVPITNPDSGTDENVDSGVTGSSDNLGW